MNGDARPSVSRAILLRPSLTADALGAIPCGVSLGYDIYPDIGLLYIRGQGVITHSEWVYAMLAWLHDPGYQHCRDALVDLAGVRTTPKIRELRELITMLKQERPAQGPRRVAVVTSTAITFVVAQAFGQLVRVQGYEFKVFMSLTRAWDWLRPGEPRFQPH